MNNKAVVISDIHLGVYKNDDDYLNSQLNFLKNQLIPYLKENDINILIIAGDLFDNRNSINVKIQNTVYTLFDDYLKDIEKIYLIIGNHDTYFNDSIDTNSLKFLNKFHNIELIDKIKEIEWCNNKFILVPWIVDFNDFITKFNNIKSDCCIGHFNITGFNFNKYKLCDDGIDVNIFNKCKKVITGHFHTRSIKNILNAEIIYIGSPYQLKRDDIDENRGFIELNLETLEYKFINNIVSSRFVKVSYPDIITKEMIEKNIVDVFIKYDDYDEMKINKYIKEINDYKPLKPAKIFIGKDTLNTNIQINKEDIKSLQDLIKEYVNSLEVENKDEIYNLLIKLYEETKNEI